MNSGDRCASRVTVDRALHVARHQLRHAAVGGISARGSGGVGGRERTDGTDCVQLMPSEAVFLSIMRTVLIELGAWSGDLDRVGA